MKLLYILQDYTGLFVWRLIFLLEGQTYLLWVEDSDDLRDGSLVKSWNHITAGGEELQLECLINKDRLWTNTLLSISKAKVSWCLLTFGTAAWKTKSVISASVELEAWMVMTAMLGLGLALSKVKSILRPFLLYAVIGGIPTTIYIKKKYCFRLQLHDRPQENTPTIQRVQTQS